MTSSTGILRGKILIADDLEVNFPLLDFQLPGMDRLQRLEGLKEIIDMVLSRGRINHES